MGLITKNNEQYYLGPDGVWNSLDENYGNYQFTPIKDIISNFNLLQATGYDVAILRSSNIKTEKNQEIHIWISSRDYKNSNMMILLGYMIHGHPDWKNAEIKVHSIYTSD